VVTVNTSYKYGTPEFYAEHFSDMIADVDSEDPATIDNILEWFTYHEQQANAYAKLRERVREALAM
jgi:hypothetical protein